MFKAVLDLLGTLNWTSWTSWSENLISFQELRQKCIIYQIAVSGIGGRDNAIDCTDNIHRIKTKKQENNIRLRFFFCASPVHIQKRFSVTISPEYFAAAFGFASVEEFAKIPPNVSRFVQALHVYSCTICY